MGRYYRIVDNQPDEIFMQDTMPGRHGFTYFVTQDGELVCLDDGDWFMM